MSIAVLLRDILNHLSLLNIRTELSLSSSVFTTQNIECQGYFDQQENVLKVGTGDSNWFLILLHEYCHVLQMLDGLWSSKDELDGWERRDSWVLGKIELPDAEVIELTRMIQACELDCEQRVIKFLKQYDLEEVIEIETYIQESNAYVLSYEVERLFRKVLKPGQASLAREVCPTHFITDLATIPPGFIELLQSED